jgi:hypothetical protein
VFERMGDAINNGEVSIFFPELSPSIRRRFRLLNVVDAVKRHKTRQKRMTRRGRVSFEILMTFTRSPRRGCGSAQSRSIPGGYTQWS